MKISLEEVNSIITKFQGEYSVAHFELVSTHNLDGQNSILKDLDCNLLLSYLVLKSLESIKEKNQKYSYDYLKNINELEPLILKKSEISLTLNYPRETVRRNIKKLEYNNFIVVNKKYISVKINNYLSKINITSYEHSLNKCLGIVEKNLNIRIHNELEFNKKLLNLKNDFSLIWYNFLKMIVEISIIWKKYHSSLECWYLFGTCALNQMYNSQEFIFNLNTKNYSENFFLNLTGKKNNRGLNPTTLSELTSIPRETVTRHLSKLIKNKTLTKNKQNLYYVPSKTDQKKNLLKNLEFVHRKVSELCFEILRIRI